MIDKAATPVGKFMAHFRKAQTEIANKVKDELYIKIYSSQMAAKRREAYEDQALWVRDRTVPIEDRVDYAIQLFDLCGTFFDAGDDSAAGEAISLMNEYLGNIWAPILQYLITGNQMYAKAVGSRAQLLSAVSDEERREVVTYFAEEEVIRRLMSFCAKSFKARDNDHNWTTAIQSPPMLPQDSRFNFSARNPDPNSNDN